MGKRIYGESQQQQHFFQRCLKTVTGLTCGLDACTVNGAETFRQEADPAHEIAIGLMSMLL